MSRVSPLTALSGYDDILKIYEQNKNKPWKKWLTLKTFFDQPGKQGLVGLFELKDDKKKRCMVFKISQHINYLAEHELTIMKGLEELSAYCPHFCKAFGSILCEVDPKVRKSGNPFEIKSRYPIEKEVLLMEYISNSYKFYNFIRSENVDEKILFSTIKQILLAITIAQKKKKFSHYDLHSYNIMMKKCDKNVVFLYVLDDDNQIAVPTFGYYPVIIDFGFSYIEDLNSGPLWSTLAHTNVGFMSDRFDWVADPKLFLVTVSGEIKENRRKSKNALKLRRIVRNIYNPLTIDWGSGWDRSDASEGAADVVTNLLASKTKNSELFENYSHYCIDLLQSLIILPLEDQKISGIDKAYKTFLEEFSKIELSIGSSFYNLYLLKEIIDITREVRLDYIKKESRLHAVSYFEKATREVVAKITRFCKLKNIHFEKMLCALICLSKNIEGVLYTVIKNRMIQKEKEYKKLRVNSTEQIYGIIEANIPHDYIYNKDTLVFIMNSKKKNCDVLQLKKSEIKEVNETHPMAQGTYLYNLYNLHNL